LPRSKASPATWETSRNAPEGIIRPDGGIGVHDDDMPRFVGCFRFFDAIRGGNLV
jgi:hypothetical protein